MNDDEKLSQIMADFTRNPKRFVQEIANHQVESMDRGSELIRLHSKNGPCLKQRDSEALFCIAVTFREHPIRHAKAIYLALTLAYRMGYAKRGLEMLERAEVRDEHTKGG